MKKHLIVATGLAVLSTGAFASKARMNALGQGSGTGSYYMQDNRNIWRSAAALNALGSHVTAEFGTDATSGVGGTAEGGFFQKSGDMTYGLYLNNDNYGNVNAVGIDSLGNAVNHEPGRADVFVASGDWGVRVGYETVTSASDDEGTGFDFGVGYNMGDMGLWFNFTPAVTTTDDDVETENNSDMSLGLTYKMNDYTIFGEYLSEGNAGDADALTGLVVGAGRTYAVDGGTMFYDIQLVQTDDGTNSEMNIPVTFGAEVKASSWLTWRLSLT